MQVDRLKTTAGLDVRGKRVIVRADLNVPVKDGKVSDATRLERLLPGLQDLAKRGARVVVISHFGRPKAGPDARYSLKGVADKLGELLAHDVVFADDCVGEAAERAVAGLRPGGIAVLENLRFHRGEEQNDPALAKRPVPQQRPGTADDLTIVGDRLWPNVEDHQIRRRLQRDDHASGRAGLQSGGHHKVVR